MRLQRPHPLGELVLVEVHLEGVVALFLLLLRSAERRRHADSWEKAVAAVHEDETHRRGAGLRGGKAREEAGQRKSAEGEEGVFEEVSAVLHDHDVDYLR